MTMAGWILLVTFWGLILGMAIFCVIHIFKKKNLKQEEAGANLPNGK